MGKTDRGGEKKRTFSFWKLMHGRDEDTVVSRPISWVSPTSLAAEQSPEDAMHRSLQVIPQVRDAWLVWDGDRLQSMDGAGSCPSSDGMVRSQNHRITE